MSLIDLLVISRSVSLPSSKKGFMKEKLEHVREGMFINDKWLWLLWWLEMFAITIVRVENIIAMILAGVLAFFVAPWPLLVLFYPLGLFFESRLMNWPESKEDVARILGSIFLGACLGSIVGIFF